MRRVESNDPDQLVYQRGGGCASLFALPFLAGGLFLIAVPFLTPAGGRRDDALVVPAIVGGLMVLGALVGALWRGGVILDRRQGKIIKWWGLPVPLRRTATPLSAYDHVFVGRAVQRTSDGEFVCFPVSLSTPQRTHLKLGRERTAQRGRQCAEEIAKFLRFRLDDETMGTQIVREASELDLSLRDRARRAGGRPAVPEPPPGIRVRMAVEGDGLSFDFPPRGFTRGPVILVVAGSVSALVVLFAFIVPFVHDSTHRSAPLGLLLPLLVVFVGGPFLLCWGFALSQARRSVLVVVSSFELRATRRGLLGRRTTAIPAGEIEELMIVGEGAAEGRADIARGPGKQEILARSDKASVAFGAGLSPEELRWLKAVIEGVLTAGSGAGSE